MRRKKKTNNEFIYDAFFRQNPPSILRLACIQLMREGVDFSKDNDKVWNLIWDRASYMVNTISKTKEAKVLHTRLINERTF